MACPRSRRIFRCHRCYFRATYKIVAKWRTWGEDLGRVHRAVQGPKPRRCSAFRIPGRERVPFLFLRNEDDTSAERAAYRPGDHLWAKSPSWVSARPGNKVDVSLRYLSGWGPTARRYGPSIAGRRCRRLLLSKPTFRLTWN